MLKVIANSTPLIALEKIGKLNILKELYGKIYIPYGVYEEVIIGGKEKINNNFIQNNDFIIIKEIKNEEARKLFLTSLHKGEVEVMILAREMEADICIIDDFLARKYAKYLNIRITGTMGVLLKAKESGIIKEIKPLLDNLIEEHIYIDKKLYKDVLQIAKEQ